MSDSTTINKCQDALLYLFQIVCVQSLSSICHGPWSTRQSAQMNLVRAKENEADVTKRLEKLRSLVIKLEEQLDHGETKIVACTNTVGSGGIPTSLVIPLSFTNPRCKRNYKPSLSFTNGIVHWPGTRACYDSYIDVAFRSSRKSLYVHGERVCGVRLFSTPLTRHSAGGTLICRGFSFIRFTT